MPEKTYPPAEIKQLAIEIFANALRAGTQKELAYVAAESIKCALAFEAEWKHQTK